MKHAATWIRGTFALMFVVAPGQTGTAQDKKADDKVLDRAALEQSIDDGLRKVIDHGADLYNQGDWNGCYRLWEGALMSVRPLVGDRKIQSWPKLTSLDNTAYVDAVRGLQSQLGERPGLKEVIDKGLATAKQTPQPHHRAYVLRVALDQVRAAVKPAKAAEAKKSTPGDRTRKDSGEPKKAEESKQEEKKATEKKPAEKKEEKKPAATTSVTGHITFEGKPLTGGSVVFTDSDGKAEGKIAADGTYKVEGAKPGVYKVSIQGAKGAAVPAKYNNPNTSGLTYKVMEGKQTFDIDLR